MTKALIAVRFRALFAGMVRQARKKGRKNTGMTILFAFLYLYLAVVVLGMMGFTFWNLAEPYHAAGLDWLYFSMAGLMGLGLAVIGSVFSTQSQLYDAKDNDLLLSMPIPPRTILLSRMVPLLAMNLLFAGLVMVPAIVVYALVVEFSVINLLAQFLSLLGITVLAQAIACVLGWGLHLLFSKMNKSAASMLYMVVFLAAYFAVYSQMESILNMIANGGQQIADALQTWVWPLYAMGSGCIGQGLHLIGFLVIAAIVFAAAYLVLSVTFLQTATMQKKGSKKKSLDLAKLRSSSPSHAIVRKELGKFLGCPAYLTNMGIGIVLTVGLCAAGVIFREKLLEEFAPVWFLLEPLLPLLICAILSFLISTMCVSTPSVSLEGKNIWILKSMPVSSRDILLAKLRFHCILTVPVSMAAGLILAAVYGCGIPDCLLSALIPGLLCILNGLIGLLTGLQWARLDYLSDAYPCKQSPAVLVTMLVMMGIPLALGLLYGFVLAPYLTATAFLALTALILLVLILPTFWLLTGWGVRKWESL